MSYQLPLTVCLLLFSLTVKAQWKPEALDLIKTINQKYKKMGTGPLTTAWGGWKRMNFSPELKGKVVSIRTKEMMHGEVKAYFYLYPTERPRPLYVYFPGIFGDIGDKITDDFIEKLEKLKGHVLVIPNFLSPTWVRMRPLYDRHPATTELLIIRDIWKELDKQIPLTRISTTHVFGESLGSIMASAWVSQKDLRPEASSLTLMWPPIQVDLAMDNLDSYLADSQKSWHKCGLLWTFPYFLKYFFFSPTAQGISESDGACLAAWGAKKGFMQGLKDISSVHAKATNQDIPNPKNFRHFFENFNPALKTVIESKDEMMNLSYWLTKIKRDKPNVNLLLLTSFDDFLNKGVNLFEVARKSGMEKENVFVFDWGGHGGPVATPEFFEFLKAQYQPSKLEAQ